MAGKCKTPEYRAWWQMCYRCRDPRAIRWQWYGARGISVCERWRTSFDAFLEDMGPRPSPKHSLDRIDNAGDYEPSNCRWATKKQQQRNTRQVRLITMDGETRCLSEWAEEYDVSRDLLSNRLSRGWPLRDALTVQSLPAGQFRFAGDGSALYREEE